MAKRSSDSGSDGLDDDGQSLGSGGSSSKKSQRVGDRRTNQPTVEMLKRLLQEREQKITTLQSERKNLKQVIRRQNSKIVKLEEVVKNKDHEAENKKSLEVTRIADARSVPGKSGSWFTPAGAISLAVA